MKLLLDPESVERVTLLLAIGGPMMGLIIGALLGLSRKRILPGCVAGALLGAVLTLVYGAWRLYWLITDRLGLDSVANLGLQLVMFAVLGCLLGVVILRISVFLKRWATD